MGTESPVTKRYIVDLGVEERARLETIVLKGKHRAQTLTKARILLLADISSAGPGWSDSKIIEALNTNQSRAVQRSQLSPICNSFQVLDATGVADDSAGRKSLNL